MDLSEYWTVNPVTSTPFFPIVMSRDRFLLLLTFIWMIIKSYSLWNGRVWPIFKVGSYLSENSFKISYCICSSSSLCHDKSMVAWHGNLFFRDYSPDKPIKYGLKSFMLSDTENAYCLKFKLYTGRSSVCPSENGATFKKLLWTGAHSFLWQLLQFSSIVHGFVDLWCRVNGNCQTIQ